MKPWNCLLLLPLVLAQQCEEPEESLLIQKSQEASVVPKKTEGELLPGFFATMGLEMAELTLKTACTNVEKATVYAQSHLPESPAPADLNDRLSQVFKTMVAELNKGVQEVTMGLKVQGLSTSLVKLKDSYDIAEKNIHTMGAKCTFQDDIELEISSCKEAASLAHKAMLATFREWINEAAAELLTKVVPWDQGKMKKFNAQKIPEITELVDSMCTHLDSLIDSVSEKASKYAKMKAVSKHK
mmetsp:Transcript_28298/g.45600  ORF Transcript_28298/g.45600 Transcript_28298/m.45600 type:complete len:242 (-) Transcript_28298:111-836(-)